MTDQSLSSTQVEMSPFDRLLPWPPRSELHASGDVPEDKFAVAGKLI
ncbi:hypothetical protein GCWU000246_01756 [Jonquetella anthropi E3_33 E1]|nr:hypothetical protein GCWU000246_01756 [Jonquetella anthropi E3_33 E1]